MRKPINLSRGLSLIEVLIAFAVTCIFLASTLPAHRDSLVRNRVSAGISQATAARQALTKACAADPNAVIESNRDAAYLHELPAEGENFVHRVELGADCKTKKMVVLVWTQNTGAKRDPLIALSAASSGHGESWSCLLLLGELRHVPSLCRLESIELPAALERSATIADSQTAG